MSRSGQRIYMAAQRGYPYSLVRTQVTRVRRELLVSKHKTSMNFYHGFTAVSANHYGPISNLS